MATVPGACILGCAGPVLSRDEARFFAGAQPWGFILFARNAEDPAQLSALTAALRDAVGRDAPVLIDQEGGRVQRLGPPHWRAWPPPLDGAQDAQAGAARAFWLRYRIIAHELRACGIDANCAPVGDVAGPETHPFLRNRCYGTTPGTVAALAGAAAAGLLEGGVLPVIKHMPGHGRGTADSHLDLPEVTAPLEDLRARDFPPFRALNALPMGMTSHVLYRAIDDAPATISPKVIALIRQELGFDGLLMTDDISMKALPGSLAERCSRPLEAGCDVILHCNGDLDEMRVAAEAAGRLSQAAQARAAAALAARQTPHPVDIPALEAELRALRGGQGHG